LKVGTPGLGFEPGKATSNGGGPALRSGQEAEGGVSKDGGHKGRLAGPQAVSPGSSPALSGEVILNVLTFLELTERAGLDLHTVTAMARGPGANPEPLVRPIRLPAEGAAITLAGQQRSHQGQAQAPQLSPVARRAQSARDRVTEQAPPAGVRGQGAGGARGLSRVSPPPQMGAGDTSAEGSGTQPGGGDTSAEESTTGREDAGGSLLSQNKTRAGAGWVPEQPESAAMGAARGALEADACMARALAAQERAQQVAATEENIKEVSRDAELAMRLITQDAEALRVDQEAALQAQANGSVGCRSQEAQGEGKGKGHAAPEPEVQERALGWEKKLGAGTWRGAEQLAEVVVQPAGDVVAAAAIRAQAQALACFAESRPLIQPNERENVEGVPD
jgi:hypothetical protein